MRSPVRLFIGMTVVALVGGLVGDARAGEEDAARLAAAIDRHVESRLKSEGLSPAATSDDAEFLRRVYLDLHGVVPTIEQAKPFLDDTGPDKRARLIDGLLAHPRYGEYLADLWQGYLISPLADDRHARGDRLRAWLAGRFNAGRWDRITTELLTATGKMEDNPAVTYLVEGRLPRSVPDLTDLASRYFLGLRLNCAQCHDHPFVDWKQEEFWGMAAFFAQVQTPRRAKQVYELGVMDDPKVSLATLREAGMLDGFVPRPPTFLGGRAMPAGTGTPRAALAAWVTSGDNPYFAKAAVNRTWWRLFGRGIVTPVDDIHEGNKPSHPELLDLLARRFVESGFDLKEVTRAIVLSKAYQRTSRATRTAEESADGQTELFGRMSLKVSSAGQLYDSLEAVFGPPTKVPGIDARAGARREFVQFFGESGDPNPLAYRRGIPQALRQMNSGQFAGHNLDALVARLATPGRAFGEVAGDLFLTILSRRPTADERKWLDEYRREARTTEEAVRELAWVLMMSGEFAVNH